MLKKLVIASAVFAASSSVALAGHVYRGDYKCEAPCAAPCTPCCQPFCAAPYVGLSLYPRVVVAGNSHRGAAAYEGFGGNLFAGYGAMMSPGFYLAGELFVGDTWKLKDYHTFGGVKTTWDVGASILPGFLVTDCILTYLRLGATDTRFSGNNNHHHFRTEVADADDAVVEHHHHHNNNNNTKVGWHVGLGGQATICGNWDLRGEYIYTQYGRLNNGHNHHEGHGNNGAGHPQSQQFNLGFIYKFL